MKTFDVDVEGEQCWAFLKYVFLKHLMLMLKVNDATSAVANVDDYSGSAQLLAATTLR